MMNASNFDRLLGLRIKAERKSRGWSLDALAERASISRTMIYKVENGESSPTASLLGKLSGAFGLSISTLMARAEASQGRLMRLVDQPTWTDPASGYVRRQISPRSDVPLDLVQVTLPAGASVPMPSSAYTFLRQLIWVLDGELLFLEGHARYNLSTGDCLELGQPTDCEFRNEGKRDCIYAVIAMRTT